MNRDFWIGVVVGVAAGYLFRHYQTSRAAAAQAR